MASSLVTFDIGQTLVDLDLDFLATRLAEREISVEVEALQRAAPAAWRHYDQLTADGAKHPWHAFVDALLAGAGVGNREPVVAWLYAQQRTRNLWRKPILPMVALARDLAAQGVRVAAVSNSEGGLLDLLRDIELLPLFETVVDSHAVGVAKPDPRIFALVLERLDLPRPDLAVHIGDSWAADVEGALAAGWNAIWYQSRSGIAQHDPRVPVARDATETRAALATMALTLT